MIKILKNKHNHTYFNGGIAPYKALKSIRRFSKDIGLIVYIDNCPCNNKIQKRLKLVVNYLKHLN